MLNGAQKGDGASLQVRFLPMKSDASFFKHGPQGNPVFVPRVLDVEKGRLCFIIGTVYMEMSLKPNVLEDIARDVS